MEELGRDYFLSDKDLVRKRFGRVSGCYNDHATVQFRIQEKLLSYLPQESHIRIRRYIEIGCGSGEFTKRILDLYRVDEVLLNDLCEGWSDVFSGILKGESCRFIVCDGEEFPFQGMFDMVTSTSVMQWFHHPKFFLERVAAQMYPKGILLLSTFGPQNFREVRMLTHKGLPYPSLTELREWLSPYFRIVVSEDEIIPLYFSSAMEVLKHMKYTGVTATSSQHWGKRELADFCRCYEELFMQQRGVSLTYHPIYIYAIKL